MKLAYKGFDKNLKCRGFQFEVGKTYDTGYKDDEIKICFDTVFHYCDTLQDVHKYYDCKKNNNRFCEIEVLGAEVCINDKKGSNRIMSIPNFDPPIFKKITGIDVK